MLVEVKGGEFVQEWVDPEIATFSQLLLTELEREIGTPACHTSPALRAFCRLLKQTVE